MKRPYLNPLSILIADDDPDDRMLMKEALVENNFSNEIHFVEDGEQLLDYLYRRGVFMTNQNLTPGLILLDLNMPKIDGREALRHIKSDQALRRIPVVVFTTSRNEKDIFESYNLGVNSFISKPARFDKLVTIARDIVSYWFDTVTLPNQIIPL